MIDVVGMERLGTESECSPVFREEGRERQVRSTKHNSGWTEIQETPTAGLDER